MSENPFDFLWKNEEAKSDVKLPVGGDFLTGFIAPWQTAIVYRFWFDQDLDEYEQAYDGVRKTSNGNFYYFQEYQAAVDASKAINRTFAPNTIWRWETETKDVLNFGNDEVRGMFGELLSYEAGITGLGSKKQRHELHMLILPSVVQSLALVGGLLKEPIFDYETLRVEPNVIDDAYQARVIGTGSSFEESELWQARMQLWAALGETNPKKYTLNQGQKSDTTSKELGMCLGILYRNTTLWARLATVPDPRVDAVSKEGKRLSLPVVCKVYRDKAAAQADVKVDDGEEKAGAAPTNGNMPPVPKAWETAPDDWIEYARKVISDYDGKPRPLVEKALRERNDDLESEYGATAEEFITWMDFLK